MTHLWELSRVAGLCHLKLYFFVVWIFFSCFSDFLNNIRSMSGSSGKTEE